MIPIHHFATLISETEAKEAAGAKSLEGKPSPTLMETSILGRKILLKEELSGIKEDLKNCVPIMVATEKRQQLIYVRKDDLLKHGFSEKDIQSYVNNISTKESPKMMKPPILEQFPTEEDFVSAAGTGDWGEKEEKEDEEKEEEDFAPAPSIRSNLIERDGKLISRRTFLCLERLEKELAKLGKVYGKAIDNGDCFWDAFAQGLSKILGRSVTIKELRQKVSEEVQSLDKGPEQENWVKQNMKGDMMDTYEQYRDRVGYTCEELLAKGIVAPVWGKEKRDGLILCRLYNVNLKTYMVGTLNDQGKNPGLYYGAEIFPSEKPVYPRTVEIAIYPGHFVPVFDKEKTV